VCTGGLASAVQVNVTTLPLQALMLDVFKLTLSGLSAQKKA